VISGVECTGKTTTANRLAAELGVPSVSRDPITRSLVASGIAPEARFEDVAREADRRLTSIIRDHLSMGHSLIVECLTDVATRQTWRSICDQFGTKFIAVECLASDERCHRQLLDYAGEASIGRWKLTWEVIELHLRDYHPWPGKSHYLDVCASQAVRDRVIADIAGEAAT